MRSIVFGATLLLSGCTWTHSQVAASSWLDQEAYPFTSQWLETPGGRMHYIDEGQGPAIVFVHGTPTWSFLYRELIQTLNAAGYRCIAMDHIGYGLSEKPTEWTSTPQAHSQNVTRLLDHLDLQDVTMIVHDFGGPIGLGAAIKDPERIERVVIFNSWMWSLEDNQSAQRVAKLLDSSLGRYLYLKRNYSPRKLIPLMVHDKSALTDDVHDQYIRPFSAEDSRVGPWKIGQELIGSSAYYDALWQQRGLLQDKPMLFIWGMEDPTFQPKDLARWQSAFPDASAITLDGVGHFPQEEDPDRVREAVLSFLGAPAPAHGDR